MAPSSRTAHVFSVAAASVACSVHNYCYIPLGPHGRRLRCQVLQSAGRKKLSPAAEVGGDTRRMLLEMVEKLPLHELNDLAWLRNAQLNCRAESI